MSVMVAEVRYALRQLGRAPGFTLMALLTLSLTVGLAATAFSVFDALLVRPLPYGHPEQIVTLLPRSPSGYLQPASWPEYFYWRDNNRAFSALAGYSTQAMNLRGPQCPAPVRAAHVTPNFFHALGVQPVLGRTFRPDENERGNNNVVVLSYAAWQKLFSGRREVVGQRTELDGFPMTIIGVMPPGVRFPLQTSEVVYAPFRATPEQMAMPGWHWMRTLARLKPGVTEAQANAEMNRVLAGFGRVQPDAVGRTMRLEPLAQTVLGETRPMVRVLVMAVLVILALGCVNVAGLMLVRGLRRERELAVRVAMGASRGRLGAGLGAEILLLAVGGTFGGALVAWGLMHAVRALLVASLARGAEIALNPAVVLASLVAALLTLLLAGFLPLRQLLSVAPSAALRSGSSGAGVGREHQRLGAAFIALQMALAMVLLVVSALLLRSLSHLRSVELGFRPQGLVLDDVNLSPGTITGRDVWATFYRPALERVRAIPGVEAAGLIDLFPIQSYGSNSEVAIEGKPALPGREQLAEVRYVAGDYYRAMGLKLLRGRLLDPGLDRADTEQAIVVNQAFVRHFFAPGEDPLNHRLQGWSHARIVGVVADARQSLYEPVLPEFDLSPSQLPPEISRSIGQEMQLVVRSTLPPEVLAAPLRAALQSVDPGLPFRPLETMDNIMDEQLTLERLESWLFGTFATLAALLAAIGLYGLVAQYVEQGRRGIGVRFALGAQRGRVVGDLMTRVGLLGGLGIVAGLAASWAARKVLASVLAVEVSRGATLVVSLALGLELLALATAAVPAYRAARVNPVDVLRAE